jgi:hypothetical protein
VITDDANIVIQMQRAIEIRATNRARRGVLPMRIFAPLIPLLMVAVIAIAFPCDAGESAAIDTAEEQGQTRVPTAMDGTQAVEPAGGCMPGGGCCGACQAAKTAAPAAHTAAAGGGCPCQRNRMKQQQQQKPAS